MITINQRKAKQCKNNQNTDNNRTFWIWFVCSKTAAPPYPCRPQPWHNYVDRKAQKKVGKKTQIQIHHYQQSDRLLSSAAPHRSTDLLRMRECPSANKIIIYSRQRQTPVACGRQVGQRCEHKNGTTSYSLTVREHNPGRKNYDPRFFSPQVEPFRQCSGQTGAERASNEAGSHNLKLKAFES